MLYHKYTTWIIRCQLTTAVSHGFSLGFLTVSVARDASAPAVAMGTDSDRPPARMKLSGRAAALRAIRRAADWSRPAHAPVNTPKTPPKSRQKTAGIGRRRDVRRSARRVRPPGRGPRADAPRSA